MGWIKALAITLLLFGASGLADAKRSPPLTDEERTVVQVSEAPGFTKDELFDGAKRWIAENFKSAEAVLDYEDRGTGTIIGNGNMVIDPPMKKGVSYYSVYRGRVGFKMKVETKDGKMRISFTGVRLLYRTTLGEDIVPQRRGDMDSIREKLLEFGPLIVASLEKAKISNDW